jgi:glutamyl-Q tRNA(Asp) synthetase
VPGLDAQFQSVLASFGFEWDGEVRRQSDRPEIYADALASLSAVGRCYPCHCSRSAIAASQVADPGFEPVYAGTCRDDAKGVIETPHATRFRIEATDGVVEFTDLFQGAIRQDCRHEAGDFVVRRRDGPFAYHLAVVVDDEMQGVTEVVRGADLLSSTPRQILLQRVLRFRTPSYGHLPLLVEPDGRKLAKSRRAVPLDPRDAPQQLWRTLEWLNQAPPPNLAGAPVREIWSWALASWQPERFRGLNERRLS